jgi:hypothetical protein
MMQNPYETPFQLQNIAVNPEYDKISPAIEESMDCEIFEIINKIKTRLSETVNERTAAFNSIDYQVRETY